MFDGIYDVLHRELGMLEEKYAKGVKLTQEDVTDIDKMAHALKCLATYEAMTSKPRSRYYDTTEYRRY